MKNQINFQLKSLGVGLALALALSTAAFADAYLQDDGLEETISSDASYSTFTLGLNVGGNQLSVIDGAEVSTSDELTVGRYADSSSNALTLSGSGAVFSSSKSGGGFFTVGWAGGSNTLTVESGATLSVTGMMLRVGFQSDDNLLKVSGAGSQVVLTGASNAAHLCVAGSSGAHNTVLIEDGGLISTPAVRVGGMAGLTAQTNSNSVVVMDIASRLAISENLYIGVNVGGTLQNIYGNTLTIADEAIVTLDGTITINPYVDATEGGNYLQFDGGYLAWKGSYESISAAFGALVSASEVRVAGESGWEIAELSDFAFYDGASFVYQDLNLDGYTVIAMIPEPGSLGLALGALGAGFFRSRRRRN